ncbi:outer membrane protein, partial [Vibrio parahaemolyticus]
GDQSYTNTGTPSQNFTGGIYGAQLGYNLQTSNIVWGIETDISTGKLNDSVRDGNYIVETGEIRSQGTIRGRLGLALGRTLPYLTAGYAWA